MGTYSEIRNMQWNLIDFKQMFCCIFHSTNTLDRPSFGEKVNGKRKKGLNAIEFIYSLNDIFIWINEKTKNKKPTKIHSNCIFKFMANLFWKIVNQTIHLSSSDDCLWWVVLIILCVGLVKQEDALKNLV